MLHSTPMQKQPSRAETTKRLILCAISFVVLFLNFAFNTWHIQEEQSFTHFQRDTESLILGRLAKSRQDGIFSAGGLTGADIDHSVHDTWITPKEIDHQYLAYFDDIPLEQYSPYLSQIGGQGVMYSILDRLIRISSTREKYEIFQMIAALLSATALTFIILWFYLEFGLTTAVLVFVTTTLSQWLIVFGRNLWWSLWAFYLPMIVLMYYVRFKRTTNLDLFRFGMVVALAVFAKCFFNGYEYITTALVMMTVPFVYYSIVDRVNIRQFIKGSSTIIASTTIAILLSVTILILQIGAAEGNALAGIKHLSSTFEKRTYGNTNDFNSEFSASLEASTLGVVKNYINGSYLTLRPASDSAKSDSVIEIRYAYLIASFMVMSLLAIFAWQKNRLPEQRQRDIALVATTWFSVLAPLSWYVIFKSHSYIHTHINFVVWQMPFTLLGFALWGTVIQNLLRTRKSTDFRV
ncbi:MAG: hypothetical protein QM730_28365 [Anaerolineales bacterium]